MVRYGFKIKLPVRPNISMGESIAIKVFKIFCLKRKNTIKNEDMKFIKVLKGEGIKLAATNPIVVEKNT